MRKCSARTFRIMLGRRRMRMWTSGGIGASKLRRRNHLDVTVSNRPAREYLKSLKNSRVYVFFKLHEKPYYYLLIIYIRKFYIRLFTIIGHRHA